MTLANFLHFEEKNGFLQSTIKSEYKSVSVQVKIGAPDLNWKFGTETGTETNRTSINFKSRGNQGSFLFVLTVRVKDFLFKVQDI